MQGGSRGIIGVVWIISPHRELAALREVCRCHSVNNRLRETSRVEGSHRRHDARNSVLRVARPLCSSAKGTFHLSLLGYTAQFLIARITLLEVPSGVCSRASCGHASSKECSKCGNPLYYKNATSLSYGSNSVQRVVR
jgi:hypothetical protein